MPEPMQAPWRWRGHPWAPTAAIERPTVWCSRTRWAVAGSENEPNSSRSPPAQNDSPSPQRWTSVMDGSTSATSERLDQLVAHLGVERVVHGRPLQGDVQGVLAAGDPHRVAGPRPWPAHPGGPPRRELGARLQGRVGGRLGEQAVVHRPVARSLAAAGRTRPRRSDWRPPARRRRRGSRRGGRAPGRTATPRGAGGAAPAP